MSKIPLELVTLGSNVRPVWNQVFFANNIKDQWEMWLEGDFVHVREKGSPKEALIHVSSCWVQVDSENLTPGVFESDAKKGRGRPRGAKNKTKVMN